MILVSFSKGRVDLNLFIYFYIDDMLLACLNKSEIDVIKAKLKSEFEMKDLGQAKRILGMEIERNRKYCTLILKQSAYVHKILEKFSMLDCKSVSLPLSNHFKLSTEQSPKTDEEFKRIERIPYANTVGSVMYLMVSTRLDLAHGISILSRFTSNPGELHWLAMKCILKYLK